MMAVLRPYLSIITLNINGLHSPIKRHRVAGWIEKQLYVSSRRHSSKDKHRLKVKGWKMLHQANNSQKKAGIAILISEKVDFKPKKVTGDKNE